VGPEEVDVVDPFHSSGSHIGAKLLVSEENLNLCLLPIPPTRLSPLSIHSFLSLLLPLLPENSKAFFQTELEPISAGDSVSRPIVKIFYEHVRRRYGKAESGKPEIEIQNSGMRESRRTKKEIKNQETEPEIGIRRKSGIQTMCNDSLNIFVIRIGGSLLGGQHILGVKNIEALVFHGPHVEVIYRHNHVNVEVVPELVRRGDKIGRKEKERSEGEGGSEGVKE
jgi:hypothetical protein